MKEILKTLKACEGAIEWVQDRTIEQAVADCHRGDWLLWLADKLEIDKRKLTLAKGMCANTVRHLMADERSINSVDAAIAYGRGEIGENELADAAAAAYAAAAYNAASHAAAAAAYNAASHAAAADAAGYTVAYASADAAGYTYADAARAKNEKQTADICREIIGQEIISKFKELL
jgi:hypothetical protein